MVKSAQANAASAYLL